MNDTIGRKEHFEALIKNSYPDGINEEARNTLWSCYLQGYQNGYESALMVTYKFMLQQSETEKMEFKNEMQKLQSV